MKNILLTLTVIFTMSLNAQDCAELFISEYVEGPGNNNAIEIYNPTNATIDLSQYTISRYRESDQTGTEPIVFQLSGLIESAEALVIGNGQLDSFYVGSYWSIPVDPIFYSLLNDHCDGIYATNSTFYFNGNDAMVLKKLNDIIDIFGKVGEDPGLSWTDDATAGYTDANGGTFWTKRQTLIRKPTIKQGVTTNPILFNPSSEYDSLPDATYSNMGSHTCDCITPSVIKESEISYVMYPNPAKIGQDIIINSKNKIKNIEIYNILGIKISTINSANFSTKHLKEGNYFIQINFENGNIITNTLTLK